MTTRAEEGERPEQDPGPVAPVIVGRSPLAIGLLRLRQDRIAVGCFAVVLGFAFVAVFAGPLCDLLGVSTDTVLASTRVDLYTGLPLTGPPVHGFDPHHPFGLAPATGDDNLATWIFGARTSLELAFVAATLTTVLGVTATAPTNSRSSRHSRVSMV